MRRWSIPLTFSALVVVQAAHAVVLVLPNKSDSVKFAVIGDFGTGHVSDAQVASQMAALRSRFPFDFVITTGDNMMGAQRDPADFTEKFERPFRALLAAGVRFYATLGNHDKPTNRSYPLWNMNGRRYYTFAVKNVRFFALDSNRPDRAELAWLDDNLKSAGEDWKICYFHHPLYSDGARHGPDLELRVLFEPILTRYGVDLVFSGHDHVYQRLTPQKGITYFVTGAAGDEVGTLGRNGTSAASFDREQTFTAIEVAGSDLFFETVSRSGVTVDAGVIHQRGRNTAGRGR